MMNPKDGRAWTEVGPHNTIGVVMEDRPEAERITLEKEHEEEIAASRRRKLACFQKTHTRVIKKTTPTPTTTVTTAVASAVTPKMTPEELDKFMDVAVPSKYNNDLSNLTRGITDDVLKTDLQNALPRQIRSVVHQVQGEA
jgi:hypothetical protein